MKKKVFLGSLIALSLSAVLLQPGAPVHAQQMTAEEYWATANTTDDLYYEDVKSRIDTMLSEYLVP